MRVSMLIALVGFVTSLVVAHEVHQQDVTSTSSTVTITSCPGGVVHCPGHTVGATSYAPADTPSTSCTTDEISPPVVTSLLTSLAPVPVTSEVPIPATPVVSILTSSESVVVTPILTPPSAPGTEVPSVFPTTPGSSSSIILTSNIESSASLSPTVVISISSVPTDIASGTLTPYLPAISSSQLPYHNTSQSSDLLTASGAPTTSTQIVTTVRPSTGVSTSPSASASVTPIAPNGAAGTQYVSLGLLAMAVFLLI